MGHGRNWKTNLLIQYLNNKHNYYKWKLNVQL